MKNVKIIHTTIKGNYRINKITSADEKTKVVATPIKGQKFIYDSVYSYMKQDKNIGFVSSALIDGYKEAKINSFKSLDDMPAEDRDFVVIHIYADNKSGWALNVNSEHDFTVAKRILINSVLKN